MIQREDGKEVLQEVRFRPSVKTPPPGYVENPNSPGQWVTPQYLDWIRDSLSGAVAARAAEAELDPEVKRLADFLAVLHLPEHTVGDRKVADPTRVEIHQSARMAQYLVDCGWRFHPEHETKRWVPTPNGPSGDLGIHVERNPDGTWPTPDPEDFYDPEKIVTSQGRDGSWVASHPCGVYAQAPTKARAHADVVQQLLTKTEEARADE